MCGIAGKIVRPMTGDRQPATLLEEFYPIKQRGPDSRGTELIRCHEHLVTLMHTRLSIIDLSDLSHQPMHDAASGWWISYNGEIYNYPEIRAELQACGWTFRSTGDTEVVLKAWAQWGVQALSRFNGMFAIAAFHAARGELWLVRDRFGVKPLAWGRMADGGISFSSSVAGVANRVRGEVDIDYCARGLRYKVYETAQSGSPFANVHAVPAGGWVKIEIAEAGVNVVEGRWYDLDSAVAERAGAILRCGSDQLIEQCRYLLESAVRLRLRSDVPVAISLSGGLDSSTVAALASKSLPQLRGFTYGSPHAAESEGPQTQEFSARVGMDVTYVWPQLSREALGDALERTMAFQEAPFSGLSVIAQSEIYRSARLADFKVLLGGQGADEIFAGYRKFFVVALCEAMHNRDAGNVVKLLYSFGLMLLHESSQVRLYWENIGRYRSKADAGFRLLDWQPAVEDLWGGHDATLSRRQIEDVQQWSLPTLLRYEDRNSMGYGIESRLPFMDYRLVELALALPATLKINNGFGKWALRKAVAHTVPDTIRLKRKKRGFDVTQDLVKAGIGAALRRSILDNRQALSAYLRPRADLERALSDESLSHDSNLLDEALMLAWLVKPIRVRLTADIGRGVPIPADIGGRAR
jgi:asparagine synthase (glutamine-hydrolysing)